MTRPMEPLFIAVRAKYYAAFASGAKTVEYRRYGTRFNERTCFVGRPVVIGHDYGFKDRLQGRIVGFHTSTLVTQSAEWVAIYGSAEGQIAACIGIELDGVKA